MSPRARAEIRIALRANASDLLAYHERRVPCREDAADLLGETLLHAWRRTAAFPVGDPTLQRMWLFGIAVKVLANHRRTVRRRSALVDRLRSHLELAHDTGPAAGNAVRDAVGRLPASHRDLVTLVHWEGFSIAEAAQLLGLNASTARSRYAKARASLREALTDESLNGLRRSAR